MLMVRQEHESRPCWRYYQAFAADSTVVEATEPASVRRSVASVCEVCSSVESRAWHAHQVPILVARSVEVVRKAALFELAYPAALAEVGHADHGLSRHTHWRGLDAEGW